MPEIAMLTRRSNHPASGNGAMTSLFHTERLGRAVPEPKCWTSNLMRNQTNQIRTVTAKLVSCLTLVLTAHGGHDNTLATTHDSERRSALAQQLVAAHYLAALGTKNIDPVMEVWSCISLRMPDRAWAALQTARARMGPAIAAVFEGEITTLRSEQTSAAVEVEILCAEGASRSNLFGASISYLQQRCAGRLWTNANQDTLSVYVTNALPMCEVRIPLRILQQTIPGNHFREIAQPLQLVTELSKLRFVLPVVNLTDSTAATQVEVRWLGPDRETSDSADTLRAGKFHVFAVTPVNVPRSEPPAQAALERSIQALSIEAAKFAFPNENLPRK